MAWRLSKGLEKLRTQINALFTGIPFLWDARRSEPSLAFPLIIRVACFASAVTSFVPVVLVTFWAVGLSCILSRCPVASQKVLPHRYGFKMFRIDAAWIAAKMIYCQSFWDWPIRQLVRHAVRSKSTPVSSTSPDGSITILLFNAKPFPAFSGLSDPDLWPKALGDWCSLGFLKVRLAFSTAKLLAVDGSSKEFNSAMQTLVCYFSSSHDLNLTDRLGLWLGSIRCLRIGLGRFIVEPLYHE